MNRLRLRVERKISRSGHLLPRAPTLISLVYETMHSPMTRFFQCGGLSKGRAETRLTSARSDELCRVFNEHKDQKKCVSAQVQSGLTILRNVLV